jgi:hypothetical protein
VAVLLALAWGLPLLIFPALGGYGLTFTLPRTTYLIHLAGLAPWWRGWWTWDEWILVAGIALQSVRLWSTGPWRWWFVGQGLVWLAGFVLLRAARGLRDPARAFLRRWWWVPFPVVPVYAFVQYWIPALDPGGFTLRGSTSYGNPLFTAEALLLVLGQSPAWMQAAALGTVVLLRTRGPLLAAALAWGLLAYRRRTAALFAVLVAAAAAWWVHPGWQSLLARAEVYRRTLGVIAASPLRGFGTGFFPFVVRQGGVPYSADTLIDRAHNDYLQAAAEWGIPLAALFAVAILRMARGSWGRTAVALVALAQFPFAHPATWALFCLTAGLEGSRERPPLRRARDLLAAVPGLRQLWGIPGGQGGAEAPGHDLCHLPGGGADPALASGGTGADPAAGAGECGPAGTG